jgi:hypothetical protein
MDGGIFDEIRHFLQQRRLRGNQTTDAAAEPAGMRFKLAPQLRFTLAAIQDDEVLEEPRLVVVEGLHLDGATGAGRSVVRKRWP